MSATERNSTLSDSLREVVMRDCPGRRRSSSDCTKSISMVIPAQISQGAAGYKAGRVNYLVSFCGYFPAEAPKYSCIVSIQKPGLPASGGLMAVLQQIENVKSSPEHVSQAKQVFQGVNTLINLAKTELEYRKFVNGMEGD